MEACSESFSGPFPASAAPPAAFLSYSEAKRTSKTPENFGKGELEGVAAAEAGNNGVAGATMIPLLALGVPGDVITAVILGAFMIHGLRPGPILFEQNLPMIYALFMGILLSSVYLFVVGKLAIRFVSPGGVRTEQDPVPRSSSYSVSTAPMPSTTTSSMSSSCSPWGWWASRCCAWTSPSRRFLIAFVLGPLLEDNFRQSLLIADGDNTIFFRNAICILFWCLTALSIFVLIRSRLQAARSGKTSVLTTGG